MYTIEKLHQKPYTCLTWSFDLFGCHKNGCDRQKEKSDFESKLLSTAFFKLGLNCQAQVCNNNFA